MTNIYLKLKDSRKDAFLVVPARYPFSVAFNIHPNNTRPLYPFPSVGAKCNFTRFGASRPSSSCFLALADRLPPCRLELKRKRVYRVFRYLSGLKIFFLSSFLLSLPSTASIQSLSSLAFYNQSRRTRSSVQANNNVITGMHFARFALPARVNTAENHGKSDYSYHRRV